MDQGYSEAGARGGCLVDQGYSEAGAGARGMGGDAGDGGPREARVGVGEVLEYAGQPC